MVRVLFINDSTCNPNWGDRAAAASLMRMIQEAGGQIVDSLSEDDLRSTSFLPAPARAAAKDRLRPFVPPVVLALRARLLSGVAHDEDEPASRIPRKWTGFAQLAEEIVLHKQEYPRLTRSLEAAQVVVIHGDGAMVGNGVIPRTDLFLTYLAKRHFAKPVTIVNHTADFAHPDLREIAEHVYPLYDDVVFRDPISPERCQSFCSGRFAADTAFQFRPLPRDLWAQVAGRETFLDVWPDRASFDPGRPYICIGGSSKLWPEGEQPSAARLGYLALITHLTRSYQGQIVLTASDTTDLSLFRIIARQLGLPLIGLNTPVQLAVDALGNADAYIGGRWHPSIFALSGGTPVIPIAAKTFKMKALMKLAKLELEEHPLDVLAASAPRIGRTLSDYLAQGEALRERLRAWSSDMRENSWENVAFLSQYESQSRGEVQA